MPLALSVYSTFGAMILDVAGVIIELLMTVIMTRFATAPRAKLAGVSHLFYRSEK